MIGELNIEQTFNWPLSCTCRLTIIVIYRSLLHLFLLDRFRDRKELLMKAEAIFHEAMMAQELFEAKAERLKQQRELCDMLYDKV